MRRGKAVWACVLASLSCAGIAQAAVIYSDNFEAYTGDADLKAPGHWGDLGGGNGTTTGLLPAGNGYLGSGQGAYSNGNSSTSTDLIHQYAATPVITDAEPLVVEYD